MKLDLAAPVPIAVAQIDRAADLRMRFPQASKIIDRIQDRTQPFKFGIARSELKLQYNFVEPNDVEAFYDAYLRTDAGVVLNAQYVTECKNKTINRTNLDRSTHSDCVTQFQFVCREILKAIERQKTERVPLVRLILGPTGSGKTAFSKGLITASISVLWDAGIVPTRIEYSKFSREHEIPDEDAMLGFIRQCQLRDFLLWYFFSGEPRDVLDDLKGLNLGEDIRQKLVRLQSQAEATRFDGEAVSLRDISRMWSGAVGYLDASLSEQVLRRFCERFHKAFLISFDGFDIVDVEDFVLDEGRRSPIDVVARILRGVLAKVVMPNSLLSGPECHFLIYLRDTTYARLQLEMKKKVGGEHNLPLLRVAPPTYSALVRKISTLIDRDLDRPHSLEAADKWNERVEKGFRESVFKGLLDVPRERPLNSAFCWNARNMKRHIGRLLFWTLDKETRENQAFADRLQVAGIGDEELWHTLISSRRLGDMPSYQVLEELFLDNTRQFRPQLRLSTAKVSNCLAGGNLLDAVQCVEDYGETVGFFDSMYNYMTKDVVASGEQPFPATLVLIRICQFILANRFGRLSEIRSFLIKIGYCVDDVKVTFFLYTLLRNEVVGWHGHETFATFDDAVFVVGLRGRILLKKMISSVSYFSEAMLMAQLPLDGLAREFLVRDFGSNQRWVLDCVFNSIVGFNLIKEIEAAEQAMAQKSAVKFDEYLLVPTLRENLSAEGKRIVTSRTSRAEKRRLELGSKLQSLRTRYTNLEVFLEF